MHLCVHVLMSGGYTAAASGHDHKWLWSVPDQTGSMLHNAHNLPWVVILQEVLLWGVHTVQLIE